MDLERLLNPTVRGMEISGIRKFSNLVANYPNSISLTIGQPDFPTPTHVKDAGKAAIDANHTTYTPNAGIPELRHAAAAFLQARYGMTYRGDDEVIVTVGSSEAIDIALRTVLSDGDEVVLPGPAYPAYDPLIRLCGATPVFVDTRETGFKLTPERLESALTERTKCVIVPYPSNPTGCVMTESELAAIADVLRDKPILVISDEIYSELVFDGQHASIAKLPGMRERTIVINGLSKSHSMTGWRIGLVFAPANLTQQMLKVHLYRVSCASSVSQYAALEALTAGANDAAPMRASYLERRDYVYQRLTAIGLDVVKPQGAFYIFPSIRQFGLSSFDFAHRLLEAERVAIVPGSAFSECGEGHLRISYAYAMSQLTEAFDRMERFAATLR